MDPLTVTLAVVSLATAVKDMVELAQKIDKSFSKVSNNLRKAQRVAKDVAEMVEKIKVFYSNHQDSLNNMENFRVTLLILLAKFKSFEASILPLLPKMGGKKLGRFIRGWWNNNKIEERILDLQSNIVWVMMEYMVDSAMRAEVKLETIHQETSRGLTGIMQGLEVLEVVRRDVSALRITAAHTVAHFPYEASGITGSDEFNRNIIMFAQSRTSTSAPMLRTPDVITEELMTTAYIKLQINNIAMIVGKMATLPATTTIDTEFRLAKIFEQPSMSILHLRHDVLRRVTTIRDLLDTTCIQTVSIYDGARALNELAVGLTALGMHTESWLVQKWAITLARTLVNVSENTQPHLAAYLALYLVNHDSGDMELINEAYAITQNLRSQHAGEVPFQILYAQVLLEKAKLAFPNTERSIDMTIEAIQVLEDIFDVRAFQSYSSSSFLNRLFSSAPTVFSILMYANALRKLGTYLFRGGLHDTALDLVLLGIAIFRKIVLVHGHVHRVYLAIALLELVQDIGGHIPSAKLIDIIDECIQLFRGLAEQNPGSYAPRLVDALSLKGYILESLHRGSEAIATWQEAANIAERISGDSGLCSRVLCHISDYFRRLKRHEDAARTATLAITTHPDEAQFHCYWYLCLSEELQQLRRYKEAAEAARASATHYRDRAIREPKGWAHWTRYLTEALFSLAHCLAASGEFSEALIAWKETVDLVDNLLTRNPDTRISDKDNYLATLHKHVSISYALEDEEDSLRVCSTGVRHFQQLLELDPQNEAIILGLWSSEFHNAYTLARFGSLQVALKYIDSWLDLWNSTSVAISESKFVEWHTSMIILRANVLDAQGSTEQALLATQKIQDSVRPSFKNHRPPLEKVIDLMVQQTRLQVNLGNWDVAQRAAEGALHLCRDNKLDTAVGTLVLSLHEVAFAALSCHDYKRAAEAAREGHDILTSPEGLEIWETSEHNISKRASLHAILSCAEANVGNISTAIEYAYRAVDVSMDIKERKADISATTAERSYMETRGNLVDILLATGHLTQAWEICKERRDYFSKRVDKWMGDYRELVPVLRILGILSCSEGRHEEGEAAAEELSRIMRTLGNAFPSLQEQVKIRLRNQAKVPILKVLDDMSLKLDCEHQAGVISLFKV